MKKIITKLIVIAFIISLLPKCAYASSSIFEKENLKIIINYEEREYENVPIIKDGRTLLPLRFILNDLGVLDEDIFWSDEERKVVINYGKKEISLYIGNRNVKIKDKQEQVNDTNEDLSEEQDKVNSDEIEDEVVSEEQDKVNSDEIEDESGVEVGAEANSEELVDDSKDEGDVVAEFEKDGDGESQKSNKNKEGVKIDVEIDVPPIIYQDRTYIPVRFISETLGKKVGWNGKTETVYIVDKDKYDRIEEILNEMGKSLEKINKLKEIDKTEFFFKEEDIYYINEIESKKDLHNKKSYSNWNKIIRKGEFDKKYKYQVYSDEKNLYYNINEKWNKRTMEEDEQNRIFSFVVFDSYEDIKYKLNLNESEDSKTYILKGEILLDDVIRGFMKQEGISEYTIKKYNMLCKISKDKMLVEYIFTDFEGVFNYNGTEYDFSMNIEIEYDDYNGDFEVYKPANITN